MSYYTFYDMRITVKTIKVNCVDFVACRFQAWRIP